MKRLMISPAWLPAAVLALALGLSSVVEAKLPPPSDEAKAKAAEAAAKSAYQGKVAAYQLCKVQDKVAAQYLASQKSGGKEAPVATPPCTEPGPFVYQASAAKPIEAAGAHSPAAAAVAPPSSTQPHGEMAPAKKP